MKRTNIFLSTLICLALLLPAPSSAFEGWTSVRTRNLFLISNVSASELRQIASWLELFHSATSGLLSKRVFNSSIPTVAIVFRSNREFEAFKPLYRGKPAELAGYFQPGDDVNYIAISLDPTNREPLSAAFHEYVHLFVKDNLPNCPLWLNEGLAEFYSTAELSNGDAVVGAPIPSYINLLRSSELLPLSSLLSVNHSSAHYNERDKRGVFYAESWALVHYLMLANNGQRQTQIARYLSLLATGVSVEASFNMAFQMGFSSMEKELGEYVRRNEFQSMRVRSTTSAGPGPLQTQALSEAEVSYYLGDLLLHIDRAANAETYFLNALAIDPDLIPAYAALGILCAKQGRFQEALKSLQRAAANSHNHLVHFYYAYALSLQRLNQEGKKSGYSPETLQTIRSHLQTTIRLAPDAVEAYHLLAYVNLVANDQLDQSLILIKKAISLDPGRLALKLVLAQIYLRLGDDESGRRILETLARQSEDKKLRLQAESLLNSSSAGNQGVPQFSTAAAASVVSVAQPGTVASTGMRIDTSGTMPTIDEVLVKYVDSLGGEARIRKLTSRVTRGKARVPGEFNDAPFEIYEKPPNKAALIIKVERSISQGFDGTAGWRRYGAAEVRRVKGPELVEMQRDCDFYAPLRLKANYAEVKLLGRVKIGYREAYLVEARPGTGEPDKFYFESSSGTLIRSDIVRSGWRERALVEIYYDDWREVDGIKVPFRITRSSPHFTIAMTVDEVKQNVPIDDMVFTLRTTRD